MLRYNFRWMFLPYCLDRMEDGRYAVLNRKYKPVGMFTDEYVTYEEHPVLVHIEKLSPSLAKKLSCEGKADLDRIYLYRDSCLPFQTPEATAQYFARLEILGELMLSDRQPD